MSHWYCSAPAFVDRCWLRERVSCRESVFSIYDLDLSMKFSVKPVCDTKLNMAVMSCELDASAFFLERMHPRTEVDVFGCPIVCLFLSGTVELQMCPCIPLFLSPDWLTRLIQTWEYSTSPHGDLRDCNKIWNFVFEAWIINGIEHVQAMEKSWNFIFFHFTHFETCWGMWKCLAQRISSFRQFSIV